MNPLSMLAAHLLLAAAVAIAFRIGTRGRVDHWGCAAIGILWPASFALAAAVLITFCFVRFVNAWTQAFEDSPPVCNECGLFAADVTIAGIHQARCTCSSTTEVRP